RAVVVRAVRDRNAEMFRLYSGMNSSMDRLCAGYSDAQLQLLADFLSRTTDAGRAATDALATRGSWRPPRRPPPRPAARPSSSILDLWCPPRGTVSHMSRTRHQDRPARAPGPRAAGPA